MKKENGQEIQRMGREITEALIKRDIYMSLDNDIDKVDEVSLKVGEDEFKIEKGNLRAMGVKLLLKYAVNECNCTVADLLDDLKTKIESFR